MDNVRLIPLADDRDKVRNVPMARVRVDLASSNGKTIFGHHVPRGISDIIVYKDEAEKILAAAMPEEDRALWKRAIENDETNYKFWRRDNKGRGREAYGGSPQAEFHKLALARAEDRVRVAMNADGWSLDEEKRTVDRDGRPVPRHIVREVDEAVNEARRRVSLSSIRSAQIVEDNLPPPSTPETENARMLSSVLKALGTSPASESSEVAALRSEIAELRSTVAALTERKPKAKPTGE